MKYYLVVWITMQFSVKSMCLQPPMYCPLLKSKTRESFKQRATKNEDRVNVELYKNKPTRQVRFHS